MKNFKVNFVCIIIICIVVALTCIGCWSYFRFHSIPFEFVRDFEVQINDESSVAWLTLRDEKYAPFQSEEYLESRGVDLQTVDFDYGTYTYIVTVGHKLEQIEYSYSDMKNRKYAIVPKQFIGHVKLCEAAGKVCLYRIKSMDIDCDYHDPSYGIEIISSTTRWIRCVDLRMIWI